MNKCRHCVDMKRLRLECSRAMCQRFGKITKNYRADRGCCKNSKKLVFPLIIWTFNWTHILIVCYFRDIQENSAFNTCKWAIKLDSKSILEIESFFQTCGRTNTTPAPAIPPINLWREKILRDDQNRQFEKTEGISRQTSPIKCADTYCQNRWAAMKWHRGQPKSAQFASSPINSSSSRLKMSQSTLQCNWSNQPMTADHWLSDPTATAYHSMLNLAMSSTPNPLVNLVSMQLN